MTEHTDIVIAGAGIGGLTLALQLHRAGIPVQVHEAAPDLVPLGAGVNLLPHATGVLAELDLLDRLAEAAVTTEESVFFTRHGQLVHREPAGRYAGFDTPQLSIHRGDLQAVLLTAFRERVGDDRLHLGSTVTGTRSVAGGVEVTVAPTGRPDVSEVVTGAGVVGADGIHSRLRKQLHPDDGPPRYSGVTMWRGVVRSQPFLTGASMVRAGWLSVGKLVVYPVRPPEADGSQLVNWVAEVEQPRPADRGWSRRGRLEDFAAVFADWHFDWLDVPALFAATETILEYPMVDQDPLPFWSRDRVTLLGDAAHPMLPRGSNGAGQAILDTAVLVEALRTHRSVADAFAVYADVRLPATSAVVLTNRVNPPDAILREVHERTGDQPFARIEDVIARDEIEAMVGGYRAVTGMTR